MNQIQPETQDLPEQANTNAPVKPKPPKFNSPTIQFGSNKTS